MCVCVYVSVCVNVCVCVGVCVKCARAYTFSSEFCMAPALLNIIPYLFSGTMPDHMQNHHHMQKSPVFLKKINNYRYYHDAVLIKAAQSRNSYKECVHTVIICSSKHKGCQ